ncbi:MAG: hypothetical protein KF862_00610 [Chitinophagaceae bacterium]|nr:hypothetical protein [Chitinophagaceae bacterium]
MRWIKRTGNIQIALIKAKTPFTATPNKRKGSSNNHITGYTINASIARGAHNTNNISQSKKVIITLL